MNATADICGFCGQPFPCECTPASVDITKAVWAAHNDDEYSVGEVRRLARHVAAFYMTCYSHGVPEDSAENLTAIWMEQATSTNIVTDTDDDDEDSDSEDGGA